MRKTFIFLVAPLLLASSCKKDEPSGLEDGRDRMEIWFVWQGGDGLGFSDGFSIYLPEGGSVNNTITNMEYVENAGGERIFAKKGGKAKKEYRFETEKPVKYLQITAESDYDDDKITEPVHGTTSPLGGFVRFKEIGKNASKTVFFDNQEQLVFLPTVIYEVGKPDKLRELEKYGLRVVD